MLDETIPPAAAASTPQDSLSPKQDSLSDAPSPEQAAPSPEVDATPLELKALFDDAIFEPMFPKNTEKVINTEKIIAGADKPPPPAPKVIAPEIIAPEIKPPPIPEIKAPRLDATPRHSPVIERNFAEKNATPRKLGFFRSFLRFTTRAAMVACLCVLAWAVGAYNLIGQSPFNLMKSIGLAEARQSPQSDDTAVALRQMQDDIRALKASVDAKGAAGDAGQQNVANSARAATGAALADLTRRVDKLDADVATKLSQVNEQLASIEQKIPAARVSVVPPRAPEATHAAETPRATVASQAPPPHKPKKHYHDAFDPNRYPAAPGSPRELGGF